MIFLTTAVLLCLPSKCIEATRDVEISLVGSIVKVDGKSGFCEDGFFDRSSSDTTERQSASRENLGYGSHLVS